MNTLSKLVDTSLLHMYSENGAIGALQFYNPLNLARHGDNFAAATYFKVGLFPKLHIF